MGDHRRAEATYLISGLRMSIACDVIKNHEQREEGNVAVDRTMGK